MKKKITIFILLLSILYASVIFFFLGIIIRIAINFIHLKILTLDELDIYRSVILSIIAGTAGGLDSWIFAKIDERKAKKSDTSNFD